MHLRCTGEGGPTVVIESGGAAPSVLSYPLQDEISRTTRVCTYDRLGFGWSDPAPGARSFEDRARDLHELLSIAGESRPIVLVAESFGGMIARAYVRLYPSEVTGLVLADAMEEGLVAEKLSQMEKASGQFGVYAALARIGVLQWLVIHRPDWIGMPDTLSPSDRRRAASLLASPGQMAATRREIDAYRLLTAAQRRPGGLGALGDRPLAIVRHGRAFSGSSAFMEQGWTQAQQRLAALSTRSWTVVAAASDHAIGLRAPGLIAAQVRAVIAMLKSTQ